VTVAERGEAPLVGALGGVIGRIAAEMHRDHGVDLRTGVSVTSLKGDANGHVHSATLSDGTTLDVDVVVAALGSIRNVEWLEGSGLAAGQWGVGCDAGCRLRHPRRHYRPCLWRGRGARPTCCTVPFRDGALGQRRARAEVAAATW
jgi:pyruvate/2-oxoglutarate dehydrogenase complex dihydrolipoamide dehydrogenase (E3) component